MNCLESQSAQDAGTKKRIHDSLQCADALLSVYMRDVLNASTKRRGKIAQLKGRALYLPYHKRPEPYLKRLAAIHSMMCDAHTFFDAYQVYKLKDELRVRKVSARLIRKRRSFVKELLRASFNIIVPRFQKAFPEGRR